MLVRPVVAFLVLASASATIAAGPKAEWPTFRGPGRTAVSAEIGLLQEWPTGGPELLWQLEGAGLGYGTVAVAEGRLYVLGDTPSTSKDGDEYLVCFDVQTHTEIWKTKVGPTFSDRVPIRGSARSTPSVAGGNVYALTPQGVLVCCDASTGVERWRKDLPQEFGGRKGDVWGYSESPLVDGRLVVCTPGGDSATIVALDGTTGALRWKTIRENDRGAGHSSIVLTEIGGVRVYVQSTASGPLGVRAADGKLLWSYPIDETVAVIPTPIIRDDLVFFVAGYKRGGALLRQKPAANEMVTIEEVYPLNIELANKHGGVVLVGNYLFGDSDDKGIPFCAEFLTGKVLWKNRASGEGSMAVAAADGRLYLRFADGTMILAKAEPQAYVEVGRFKVPGSGDRPDWSHPVIVGGKLYLREQNSILCYDVSAQP